MKWKNNDFFEGDFLFVFSQTTQNIDSPKIQEKIIKLKKIKNVIYLLFIDYIKWKLK